MKNIHRIIICIMAAVAAVSVLGGCQEDIGPEVTAISLVAPDDNASVDLADGNVRFAWDASGTVPGGFRLVLASDPDGGETETWQLASTVFSREIRPAEFDLMMKGWGRPADASSPVYWTVMPAVDGEATAPEWRTLNVRRLETAATEIYLRTPQDNAFFDLGDDNLVAEFSWEGDPAISGYRIEFSTTQDGEPVMTDAKLEVTAATSLQLTADILADVLESSGLEDDVAVLYWKVCSTDELNPGVSRPRRIRLMAAGAEGVSAVSNLKVTPGYGRFILTADITDPRTAEVVISYGDRSETVQTDPDQETLLFERAVEEGIYDFSVVSHDSGSGESEAATVDNVSVYGDSWLSSKSGRQMTLSSLTSDGALFSLEAAADTDMRYSELTYTAGGQETVMRVENDQESVLLPAGSADMAQTVTLKSYFAPAEDVLDTVAPGQGMTAYLPEYGMLVSLEDIRHYPADDNTGALPNEMSQWNASFPYSMMFDGITDDQLNMWHTPGTDMKVSEENPIIATFDLGAEYCLGSYRVWGRYAGTQQNPMFDAGAKLSYFAFGSNNPRKFRLYGCADEPKNTTDESYWAVDGGWLADWTMLAESEVVRPSVNVPTVPVIDGEDNEFYVPTAEDFEAAVAGAEFPVVLSGEPVRYVRILITETWNPDQLYRISFGEMHFFSYTPEE